jgi:hypothetical protein
MVGQAKRLAQPLGLTRTQRRIALGLALFAVLGVAGVGVWALTDSSRAIPRGCIQFTTASYTGGATFRLCGRQAAEYCAAPAGVAALPAGASLAARTQCRRAGYPVGR